MTGGDIFDALLGFTIVLTRMIQDVLAKFFAIKANREQGWNGDGEEE